MAQIKFFRRSLSLVTQALAREAEMAQIKFFQRSLRLVTQALAREAEIAEIRFSQEHELHSRSRRQNASRPSKLRDIRHQGHELQRVLLVRLFRPDKNATRGGDVSAVHTDTLNG